ncbi:MAG: glycosyltransferase [Candidatus Bathyarchaeia archaeon]
MTKRQTPKIAIFLPSLRGGGAERVMVNLARGFYEQGLIVDLVLAKAEGPYLSEVSPGIRTVDFKVKRVLHALPGLIRYLRRERPKALLSAMSHANIVAIGAKKLSQAKSRLVISEHNTLSQATKHTSLQRVRFMPFLIRRFYPWADAVVAVSYGVAEDLVAQTGLSMEKIKVIYNPVVTLDLFAKAKEPLDHPWFALGQPPVILGVGKLTLQKDFGTLIRAFALVRKECPARLLILGEGEERPKLEALVRQLGLEGEVSLAGFVNNPYKYMKRAAVLVLSSRWEGLPSVLIEAMALGTALVSTNCPSGPAEILEGGKWGKLVPLGDPEALACAILETLHDPPPPVPKSAWKRFCLDKVVTEYCEVLGVNE